MLIPEPEPEPEPEPDFVIIAVTGLRRQGQRRQSVGAIGGRATPGALKLKVTR